MGNKQRQGVKTNLINNNIPYSSCKHFVSCTSMHRVASTVKRRVFNPFSAKKKRFIWALVYNKGLTQLHLVYFVKINVISKFDKCFHKRKYNITLVAFIFPLLK